MIENSTLGPPHIVCHFGFMEGFPRGFSRMRRRFSHGGASETPANWTPLLPIAYFRRTALLCKKPFRDFSESWNFSGKAGRQSAWEGSHGVGNSRTGHLGCSADNSRACYPARCASIRCNNPNLKVITMLHFSPSQGGLVVHVQPVVSEVVVSGTFAQVEGWTELLRQEGIQYVVRWSSDEHRIKGHDRAEVWVDRAEVDRARSAIRGARDGR